ncbi:MAG: hypothetical protein ABI563_10680 [Specibacter sp.]
MPAAACRPVLVLPEDTALTRMPGAAAAASGAGGHAPLGLLTHEHHTANIDFQHPLDGVGGNIKQRPNQDAGDPGIVVHGHHSPSVSAGSNRHSTSEVSLTSACTATAVPPSSAMPRTT